MGAYKTQEKIDECMQFNILLRKEREPEKADANEDKKDKQKQVRKFLSKCSIGRRLAL